MASGKQFDVPLYTLLIGFKDGTRRDLSHLDRNLDSLIQELASRCQLIFARAGAAASRSASVSTEHLATSFDVPAAEYGGLSSRNIRERVSTSKVRKETRFGSYTIYGLA